MRYDNSKRHHTRKQHDRHARSPNPFGCGVCAPWLSVAVFLLNSEPSEYKTPEASPATSPTAALY